jgi:photosystem II stability/assembly factor-like uncharacterized protein
VLKLNAAGNAVVYSTYLGGEASICGVIIIIGDDGAGTDKGLDIAVDSQGSAIVTGFTHSCDFPTTTPQQAIFMRNAFVSKLNPAGNGLVYSFRLGGNDVDAGYGVAVDSSDNAYVTGETFSVDFPVVAPLQQSNAARLAFKTTNSGASWTTLNSGLTTTFGSPVTAVAVDPATPSTVYAGTLDRGLFKTTDSGATWTTANNGFCCPPSFFREVTEIVIDPSSPSTVYVGTRFSGVFKSTNGGSTWSEANTGIGSAKEVLALAIDPASPSTLYAGLGFGQGIYKTTTGGATWSAVNTGLTGSNSVVALAVDPSAPSNVYAANGSGVFKTTTGGAGWNPSGTGLTNPIFAFAIDPSSPAVVYAAGSNGVFKTTTGGANWTPKTTGLPNLNLDDAISLAIDPASPSTLYVGFIQNGVFKTVNGADNWTAMSTGLSGSSLAVNDIALNPASSSTLYAGTDGGVFKSINGASNWAFSSTVALSEREITVIAVDPTNASIVYAGTDGGGVQKSTDGGTTWSAASNGLTGLALDVDALAIDPVTPSTIYAGTVGGVFKSTNGGANWVEKNSGFNIRNTNGLAIDPTNTQVVYAALFGSGVYKSINGGDSWTPHNNGLAGALGVHSVTIDPSNTLVVYAGTTNNVYKSTDGGASWIVRNTNMGGGDETLAVVVDPTNSMIAYAATDIGVYRTTNGANTWSFTNFNVSAFVHALAIDHTSPQTLYAATDKGIFKTTDGASTWTQLTSGLSGVAAVAIALARSTPSTVYAAFLPTSDAFITKVSPTGVILYSTYLGGSGIDTGLGVAVSTDAHAHVTGQTNSPNFPLASALQSTLGGLFDAFATKLNANGSALVFSTYLGGSGYDRGLGVAVDPSGNVYLAGGTNSPNFPTLNALQSIFRGGGFLDPFRGDAFISKLNPAGTSLFYSTFHGGTSYDAATRIAADSAGSAYVVGVTESPNFPTLNAFQPSIGSTFLKDAFVSKIIDDTGPPIPTTLQLSASNYNVNETEGSIQINVTRTGGVASAVSVNYETVPGSANDTSDYIAAFGTLRFAAGEMQKSFTLFITNDVYVEPSESLSLTLSQPTGGATLGTPSAATVQIASDDTTPPTVATNPILDAQFFVRQHYRDFFNREADASGLGFWTGQITSCGTNPVCTQNARINVSGAFFLSIEFQQTGYYVYRMHQAALGSGPQLRLRDFLPDTQSIGRGVIVGQGNWQQQLDQNKQAYAEEFVQRPQFLSLYPQAMSATQFVNALNGNTLDPQNPGAGGSLSPSQRDFLVGELAAGRMTRGQVLRAVVEDADFNAREKNRAFVLMQYFGYLRRNPPDPPEPTLDFQGYNFWLNKLNQFGGDFHASEMVKAFLVSLEYKMRFGPV